MTKILLTGANGLIGRILASHLSQKGYEIFGVDNKVEGHPSSRFVIDGAINNILLKQPFCGKYFQSDITDLTLLRKTIGLVGKIDIIIHLATASEMDTAEAIKKVNETATENIFQLCQEKNIKRVILASSIMTVGGILLNQPPYSHINNGEFDKLPTHLEKINVRHRAMPTNPLSSVEAYINSKFKAEDLAQNKVKEGIATFCLRFGAISASNIPYDTPCLKSIWCSHNDLCHFVELALKKLCSIIDPIEKTYYVCSNNNYLWVDMSNSERDFGFIPKDNAENTLKILRSKGEQATVATFTIFNTSSSKSEDSKLNLVQLQK